MEQNEISSGKIDFSIILIKHYVLVEKLSFVLINPGNNHIMNFCKNRKKSIFVKKNETNLK